jgi:hypothetical protein
MDVKLVAEWMIQQVSFELLKDEMDVQGCIFYVLDKLSYIFFYVRTHLVV